MLALGEFGTDNFSAEGTPNGAILWILFIVATFLSQITILNMLIAIMGDTFDSVYENKAQAALKEKISILKDFVAIVGIEKRDTVSKFIFAATPTNMGADEGGSWDGKIGAIKKGMEDSLKDQKSMFNKKMSSIL